MFAAKGWRARVFARTVRRKRTPGFRRLRISPAWEPTRCDGSLPTMKCASTSDALRAQIHADIAAGEKPFLVIGNAGTVSTGAMDPLPELAALCREFDLWFHVDGAYGGFAAVCPMLQPNSPDWASRIRLRSIRTSGFMRRSRRDARWCAIYQNCETRLPITRLLSLWRRSHQLFRSRSAELARLSRAESVARAAAGRAGRLCADDLRRHTPLARHVRSHRGDIRNLEALTQGLSITTFRYVPADLKRNGERSGNYLNDLNRELLTRLQQGGEAYLSNAMIGGQICAARVHRELPHLASGCGSAAADRCANWKRGRQVAAAGETRLKVLKKTSAICRVYLCTLAEDRVLTQ